MRLKLSPSIAEKVFSGIDVLGWWWKARQPLHRGREQFSSGMKILLLRIWESSRSYPGQTATRGQLPFWHVFKALAVWVNRKL